MSLLVDQRVSLISYKNKLQEHPAQRDQRHQRCASLHLISRTGYVDNESRNISSIVSGVECLPLEVLQDILFYALGSEGVPCTEDFPATILDLQTVSRGWRTAIESDPRHWSTIEFSWGKKWLGRALSRSKNAPLKVVCLYEGLLDDFTWVVEFLVVLSGAMDRCRDLTLIFESHPSFRSREDTAMDVIGNALTKLLSVRAPLLARLCLSLAGWCKPQEIMHGLFSGHTPQLRSIDYLDSLLPYHTLEIASLDTAPLSDAWSPSVADLFSVIQNSTNLLELTLSQLDVNTAVSFPEDEYYIHLPNLEILTLRGLSNGGMDYAMRSIVAPKCTQFVVECNLGGDAVTRNPSWPFLLKLNQLLTQGYPLRISMALDCFELECQNEHGQGVHVTLLHPGDQLETLRSILQPPIEGKSTFTTTTLDLSLSSSPNGVVAYLGRSLPSLTSANISCHAEVDWWNTMAELTQPQRALSGGIIWSNLASLSVLGSSSSVDCQPQHLQRLLQFRQLGMSTMAAPKKLKNVSFRGPYSGMNIWSIDGSTNPLEDAHLMASVPRHPHHEW